MKKRAILASVIFVLVSSAVSAEVADMNLESFRIRPITGNEFYSFVEIFGEMRGPLRKEILKDRKKDFEKVDPLKYVIKLKGEKDVKRVLKKYDMTWPQFTELFGNVILAYFSIQPDVTKVALIREMAGYGLAMSEDQIPREYRELVENVLKTDQGAALANIALEYFLNVPEQNIAIVKEHKLTLDKTFYTRFWKDKIVSGTKGKGEG